MDSDYAAACKAHGVSPEVLSLRMLFDWADIDGNGKATRNELSKAMPLLARVSEGTVPTQLSHKSWQKLDEDGNGTVTFVEFAEWAGPRLGLPLGEDQIHSGDGSAGCGVLCCPCPYFQAEVKSDILGTSARHGKGKRRRQQFPAVSLCAQCGHKEDAHFCCGSASMASVSAPSHWENQQGNFTTLVPTPCEKLHEFQHLLDETYLQFWTRDRKKHGSNCVPRGFRVVEVQRNENRRLWARYALSRVDRLRHCAGDDFLKIANVRTNTAMARIRSEAIDQMNAKCNEWYLFHGTSSDAATAICQGGFRMSAAGKRTGTLYGRGAYFAESITKADEYATADAGDDYTVLLCRVLGGHIRYTAETEPDSEALVSACVEGPYHCVLGDREQCSGTYREFVVFDSAGVYPEYAIKYSRII